MPSLPDITCMRANLRIVAKHHGNVSVWHSLTLLGCLYSSFYANLLQVHLAKSLEVSLAEDTVVSFMSHFPSFWSPSFIPWCKPIKRERSTLRSKGLVFAVCLKTAELHITLRHHLCDLELSTVCVDTASGDRSCVDQCVWVKLPTFHHLHFISAIVRFTSAVHFPHTFFPFYPQDDFLFSVSIVSGFTCGVLAVAKFMLGRKLTSRALITDGRIHTNTHRYYTLLCLDLSLQLTGHQSNKPEVAVLWDWIYFP